MKLTLYKNMSLLLTQKLEAQFEKLSNKKSELYHKRMKHWNLKMASEFDNFKKTCNSTN